MVAPGKFAQRTPPGVYPPKIPIHFRRSPASASRISEVFASGPLKLC